MTKNTILVSIIIVLIQILPSFDSMAKRDEAGIDCATRMVGKTEDDCTYTDNDGDGCDDGCPYPYEAGTILVTDKREGTNTNDSGGSNTSTHSMPSMGGGTSDGGNTDDSISGGTSEIGTKKEQECHNAVYGAVVDSALERALNEIKEKLGIAFIAAHALGPGDVDEDSIDEFLTSLSDAVNFSFSFKGKRFNYLCSDYLPRDIYTADKKYDFDCYFCSDPSLDEFQQTVINECLNDSNLFAYNRYGDIVAMSPGITSLKQDLVDHLNDLYNQCVNK